MRQGVSATGQPFRPNSQLTLNAVSLGCVCQRSNFQFTKTLDLPLSVKPEWAWDVAVKPLSQCSTTHFDLGQKLSRLSGPQAPPKFTFLVAAIHEHERVKQVHTVVLVDPTLLPLLDTRCIASTKVSASPYQGRLGLEEVTFRLICQIVGKLHVPKCQS